MTQEGTSFFRNESKNDATESIKLILSIKRTWNISEGGG
jgi:hypothetical protein